jgi:hypothetical protein
MKASIHRPRTYSRTSFRSRSRNDVSTRSRCAPWSAPVARLQLLSRFRGSPRAILSDPSNLMRQRGIRPSRDRSGWTGRHSILGTGSGTSNQIGSLRPPTPSRNAGAPGGDGRENRKETPSICGTDLSCPVLSCPVQYSTS